MSSTPEFKNPRHLGVWNVLESLDAEFLADASCYFGGGTRIVMGLSEFRDSADIDFLCADSLGYRKLRNTIAHDSLGSILSSPLTLAREVRADRYGIRTYLTVDGKPLKFEVISEGRVAIDADPNAQLPVPALDAASCFAEKFLANADRWADRSVLSRDVIDLAFMINGWGVEAADVGLQRAADAYGEVVFESTTNAIKSLDDSAYRRKCLRELAISEGRVLRSGLRVLSKFIADREPGEN